MRFRMPTMTSSAVPMTNAPRASVPRASWVRRAWWSCVCSAVVTCFAFRTDDPVLLDRHVVQIAGLYEGDEVVLGPGVLLGGRGLLQGFDAVEGEQVGGVEE